MFFFSFFVSRTNLWNISGLKLAILEFFTFPSINQKRFMIEKHAIPFWKALYMRFSKKSCMFLYYKYFLIYRPKRNKIQVFFSSFFVSRTNKKNIYPPNGLKIHSFFCPCIWQGFFIGKPCDFWALEAPEAWMYRQFEGEKTVKRKKTWHFAISFFFYFPS